ncbi:MAG TPA: DNA polymerase/3'-5' exonuclease PolX [Candidatus Staskawiczbacteria bacterium]|nr:DNA polymerase/3'-5' exonuclease PolX [Candidatus Staskawiczbacteria bacterium]
MRNQEIAKIFYEIADFLDADKISFKPYAYRRAAASLENLGEDVFDIYKRDGIKGLKDIDGIGESIAEHIEEYLKTGKIKIYEKYKKQLPLKIDELTKVEGLGIKKIKVLYNKLGIKNLKDLERSAKAGKIAPLFGFGEKTEKNILQGIEFLKRDKGRFLLGEILPVAENILQKLESLKEVDEASLAGSVRRRKETIGDVDVLAVSKTPEKVMDYFTKLEGIEKIWAKGDTKSSVRVREGFDIDLRIVSKKSYGSALQYFTGNKDHNILTRKIAIEKGLKLSEYGLFKGSKQIAGQTEEGVYKALGMKYPEPELRENTGEVEEALHGKLPELVELKDIRGDLHCHTTASDGRSSLQEMIEKALELGYDYIGISDHTRTLGVANGLNEKDLLTQHKEIERIRERFKKQGKKITILHGCELNILEDGSVDIKDEVLQKLDYRIASIHSLMKMEKSQMTKRLVKAMQNPYINIIGHPSARLIGERDEIQIDWDKFLAEAKKTGTILEISSQPKRLDLRDIYIRRAKELGIGMIIDTDSHHKEQLDLMRYGVWNARRGWAEKVDIVNTLPIEDFIKRLKR